MHDCYDTSFFTQSQIDAIWEIWDSPTTAEQRLVNHHEPGPEETLDDLLDCAEAA
jgi:hypothetical protein